MRYISLISRTFFFRTADPRVFGVKYNNNTVEMNAVELTVRDGVYRARGREDSVSNCVLRLLRPIKAGERSGYVGLATHKSGASK